MLKKTLTYENFDGEKVTETFHFHLRKTELLDHMDLKPRLEGLQEKFSGEQRELTTDEVLEVLQLVKDLMKMSFGVRDGDHFRKSPEIYKDFEDSAAYDELLFDLFSTPENAFSFMAGIMPKDLMEQAKADMETRGVKMPSDFKRKEQPAPKPVQEVEEFDDSKVLEGDGEEDLSQMSDDDLRARLEGRAVTDLSKAEMVEGIKRGLALIQS